MFIVVNYDDGTAEYLECWDDVASPDENASPHNRHPQCGGLQRRTTTRRA